MKIKKKLRIQDLLLERTHRPRGQIMYDVQMYLVDRKNAWQRSLKASMNKHKAIKYDARIEVKLQKRSTNDVYIYCTPCFRSQAQVLLSTDWIEDSLEKVLEQILNAYDVFMKEGSGWVLHNVQYSQINIYRYHTRGGSGGKPPTIRSTRKNLLPHQFVNKTNSILTFPPTSDEKCFLYCVLAALYPLPPERTRDTSKIKAYMEHEKDLNTENLHYPVTLDQIPDFEKKNNLTINVISLDSSEDIFFLYKSRHKSEKVINLLLFKNHYSLIRSWNCFLNFSGKHKRKLCQSCGNFYCCEKNTKANDLFCSDCSKEGFIEEIGNPSVLKFKEVGEKQKFLNYKNVSQQPFVYYCDLETVLVPNPDVKKTGSTIKKKIHQPIAISLLRCCTVKKYSHTHPIIHVGKDCIEKFYQELKKEIDFMDDVLSTVNHPIDMTEEQELAHRCATECYVCNKFLQPEEKLRDHNHLKKRRNYLGAICNECNLNRTDTKMTRTPLIFHNGGRFDIHFLIQKLHVLHQPVTRLLGKTSENIMSMELFGKRLVVIDSINHLSSSLGALVEILKKSDKPLEHTARSLDFDQDALALLSRKGVFPYDFLESEELLYETRELPEREKFYDELAEKDIDQEDYTHAKTVWKYFNCKNLLDYMVVYLQSDVTLLADVFENYRKFFHEKFSLDCTRYLSLPALSYDCMLKYTGNKLDFIYDKETYDFLKKGIRGGVSMIPHRYAEANNPGLESYDTTRPTSYLVYLDCNALYSSVMTKKLPYKKLKWVSLTKEDVLSIAESYDAEDSVGYLIECDLKYPTRIHDLTKDLPLAPEHRTVTEEMLSPYTKQMRDELGIAKDKIPKLLSTQYDKERYVCHIENLQFYLKQGMKLKKVHRALRFKQKAIFKPYVELCINERNKPNTGADEKAMWKLCCNSIFGKTIMNVEKKSSLKLLTEPKKVLNAIRSPRFKHADVINSKVVQIAAHQKAHLINTPYYVGVTILELSKLVVMRMHYEHFLKKYGIFRLKLCMTDTDSLLYYIETENLYEELKEMGIVEFSNYPEDHPYHDKSHAGHLFYLKDESAGRPIKCFVGLRAKSYSIEYDEEKYNKMVGKGVPRAKLKRIRHEDMKYVLKTHAMQKVTSNQLRSYKHEMYSIQQEKVALSPFDNKRYMCEDGIHTLPHGHIETILGEACSENNKRKTDNEEHKEKNKKKKSYKNDYND